MEVIRRNQLTVKFPGGLRASLSHSGSLIETQLAEHVPWSMGVQKAFFENLQAACSRLDSLDLLAHEFSIWPERFRCFVYFVPAS